MYLRKLKEKDALFMMEWMHDTNVTYGLKKDFPAKTILDCESFIKRSQNDKNNLHMAIVDEEDVYMGTVSLKNIDMEKKRAEFAIVVRSCAMGKGYSRYGMNEIIRIGFERIKLDMIYWNVLKNNLRAIRFYDKNHYKKTEQNFCIGGGVRFRPFVVFGKKIDKEAISKWLIKTRILYLVWEVQYE